MEKKAFLDDLQPVPMHPDQVWADDSMANEQMNYPTQNFIDSYNRLDLENNVPRDR